MVMSGVFVCLRVVTREGSADELLCQLEHGHGARLDWRLLVVRLLVVADASRVALVTVVVRGF